MGDGFDQPAGNRHSTELVGGVKQIRIPGRRNWVVVAFLLFWLVMWTFGGLAAIISLVVGGSLFSLVWLCFWAAAWLFVLSFGMIVLNNVYDVAAGTSLALVDRDWQALQAVIMLIALLQSMYARAMTRRGVLT